MDLLGQSPLVGSVADRSRPGQTGVRTRILRILILASVATGCLTTGTAGAGAATPSAQPLVPRTPTATRFDDTFRAAPAAATARAQAASAAGTIKRRAYAVSSGGAVTVEYAAGYVVDPSVGATYVAFLDSLPHGAELGKLTVRIVPPADMDTDCGGQAGDDILACYDPTNERMYVPGQEIAAAAGGVTTSYVIAHEYGHHVAANRSNAPFDASTFGPKYWSSYERVCALTEDGQLFPGNESTHYTANPGEDWAETYARLTYPTQPWTFSSLLTPDAGALAAARADVLTPWTGPVTRTFTGSFSRAGKVTQRSSSVNLTLDGTFSVRLVGPRAARYDLKLKTNGGTTASAKASAKDVAQLSYQAACRSRTTEKVTLTAMRRPGSGGGPYRLTVTYDG